jgi:hypothetical protein
MPPKRKALAESDSNKAMAPPPAKKTTKAASTTKKAAKPTARKFKYTNEDAVLLYPNSIEW